MRSDLYDCRHNWAFETTDSVTCLVNHDKKWAPFLFPDVAPSQEHSHVEHGEAISGGGSTPGSICAHKLIAGGPDEVRKSLLLRVEFQTLKRLQKNSNWILFTVRTYCDPLAGLEV
eukprot:SAG31_NODE_4687_length_3031_cov_1.632674_3_plen_116_part_00